MPTERFYRLAKEKAEKIRIAAIQEFKRVPPDEASINKIIQSADISRGSFYTYFEDKDDLLEWVMGDLIEDYRNFYITGLKAIGGNIWEVFDQLLDHTVKWISEQGLVEIVGNMMRGSRFSEHFTSHLSKDCAIEQENLNSAEQIYKMTDPKYCDLDLQGFRALLGMHISAHVIALKLHFANGIDLDELRESYRRSMRLLRYGACPRPETEKHD